MGLDEMTIMSMKVAELEKRMSIVESRKEHCDLSRGKIYDRLALLENVNARSDERLINVEKKLDEIKTAVMAIQNKKNEIMYDLLKFLFGAAISAITLWFINGRLN